MIKYTFQISNSWNTKREKIVLLCMIIKVITRLRVRSFLKWQTWWSANIYVVSSDIDECKGNHSCHVNATCTNTNGSYLCECHPGFNGNGQSCTGEFNLFAIIFRMFLLEPSLRLLRWPLSAISLVSHMLTILVCLKSAWSCSLMRWLRKKELRFGSCWIH